MSNYNSDELIHIKDGDVEYIKFKILEKYSDKFLHLITLRHGGVSSDVYKSLNFRAAGNDDVNNVLKNLDIVSKKIGINSSDVFKGKQDHTDNIVIIDNENKEQYRFSNFSKDKIDGYIVKDKNINTLVTTADCNPIIIYDPVRNIVSNVHSGWKGTLARISLKAAKIMNEKFNSNFEDLIVCIGPSIRKCCFTSKEEEFKEKFTNVFPDENSYITKDEDGTYHFDLIQVISNDLVNIGVKKGNIKVADICTACNENDFYSYRKAKQRKDKDYATFATIVGIK